MKSQLGFEGGGSKLQRGAKHDVLSLSPDLAKLNLKCHMDYQGSRWRSKNSKNKYIWLNKNKSGEKSVANFLFKLI